MHELKGGELGKMKKKYRNSDKRINSRILPLTKIAKPAQIEV